MAELMKRYSTIPPNASELIAYQASSAAQFLAGSTSKRIPYEIAHALRAALLDWVPDNVIVTTALSPDLWRGFYFLGVPQSFSVVADAFLGIRFKSELVQISLPEIYRHRPIYNIPLYHELGHFIDDRCGVSKLTFAMSSSTAPPPQEDLDHRMEHFADLFCANYVGIASADFLVDFAGMQPSSPTHPSTLDREKVVRDFLSNTPNPVVDSFQAALKQLSLPILAQRHTIPDASAFDNVVPPLIKSDAEMHGLFLAGYQYLKNVLNNRPVPWNAVEQSDIEAIVNDLTEKAIRTRMVKSRWSSSP